MGRWTQLRLLLWKNYILQFRRPVGTVMEILVPILAIVFLIIIRRVTDSALNEGIQCMSTFNEHPLTKTFSGQAPDVNATQLSYSPANNSDVEFVMAKVRSITGIASLAFATEDEAVKAAGDEKNFIGAVIFTNVIAGNRLPDAVAYSLRVPHSRGFQGSSWQTEQNYPIFSSRGPRKAVEYFSGFTQVEYAVNQGLIALKVRDHNSNQTRTTLVPTLARQFPFPSYEEDTFSALIQTILPLLLIVAFIYTAGTVVRELVLEKQERLKETMKMMGLANWIHWLAWFIKQFSFNLISVIIMTLMAVFGNIFKESNGGLIFLFFFLFVLSGIAFMFMISTFFSSAKLGMIFGFLLWFTSFFPYLILISPNIYALMDRNTKSLACLLSNMCMGFAASQILNLESKGVGLQTSNIRGTPDDDFSVGQALGMMTLDVVLYFLICWYKEAVFPGKYGIPQPWYFPFTKSYWLGHGTNDVLPVDSGDSRAEIPMDGRSNQNFEQEPSGLATGIKIDNLRKVFKGNNGYVNAVDGISLNMFKGQITALLGHNGAGKTTTMSMLTGLFPPTSGDAVVNGSSIRKDISGVRKSLGLCPQHNVLFDRLTVREHLHFFLSLKGHQRGPDFDEQIDAMLRDLQLEDKKEARSTRLSGGMKRKLSVGIALIGHSEIVILDEPTAGMDPYARRATWDLLTKHKSERTVLLTTHYMEEADLLGDRIAIMAEGQIRCSGSSAFLKQRYGVGYHLTMVKGDQCNPAAVRKYMERYIPTAKLHSNVGRELSFLLPRSEEEKFPALFQAMEEEIRSIGIESFGLSQTTMEEVFLRVENTTEESAEDRDERQKKILAARDSIRSIPRQKSAESPNPDSGDRLSGCALWLQQFWAVYVKRFLNSKRDIGAVISQMLLPVVFTIFALLVIKVAEFGGDNPPLKLSLGSIAPTNGYFADFAQKPGWRILESADSVLKTVGVTAIDSLNSSTQIKRSIGDAKSKQDCCKFKYLVLNEDCIGYISAEGEKFSDVTCSDDSDFGYKSCKFDPNKISESLVQLPTETTNCLFFSRKGNLLPGFSLSNAVGVGDSDSEESCPIVPTSYINSYDTSYFAEHILRESGSATDANVFFEENSCGFTLVDPVTTVNYTDAPADPEGVGMWATVWYSNQPLHAIPAAVNAFSNMLLRYFLGDVGATNVEDFSIEVTNHPLPKSPDDRVEAANSDAGTFVLPFLVSFGMAFLSASFITFPVAERISRSKHLQFLSGLVPTGYWLATLAWDFCNYLFPAVVILILFAAFQIDIFINAIGSVILLLILYAWANLPLVYLFSFLFSSPYTGFAITALILVLTSLLGTVLIFVLLIPSVNLPGAADICRYVFYLQPNFAFSQSLSDLYRNGLLKEACSITEIARLSCLKRGVFVEDDLSLTSPGIGIPVVYLFFEGLFFFALVLLVEYRFFIPIRDDPALKGTRQGDEDEDVNKEREEVMSPDFDVESSIVVAKDLTKQYRKSDRPAVDHLTFSIPRGECFGLLGLNGAGKTTTFKILTGDLAMSAGTAFIEGLNIRTDLHQVQRRIGYCPQFDSLIERLTGREYLTCIARLRGYPPADIPGIVQRTINRLDLEEYADRTCGTYSGGNKRKLSTAVALVGDPSVVFLDEPTAGMDPKARRFLWDCLVDVLKEGRSIVLTSHSMEECEALCTRLGILVNGQFKCLGSIQHLKSRFGSGLSLTVLVGDMSDNTRGATSTTALKSFIQEKFPRAQLTGEHGAHLAFNLEGNLGWSYVFNTLETAKKESDLNLGSYSVSQTTLEEVFLHFAREQKEDEKAK